MIHNFPDTVGCPSEFFVQYHITQRCNLSCSHCYQRNYPHEDELSTIQIRDSLQDLSKMVFDWRNKYDSLLQGVVQLTGGEPLERCDWKEIADHCIDNSFHVVLLTNGTLLANDDALFLSESKIDVQISLDGLESTHERIRGSKSFNKALKGIEFLLNNQVNCSVCLTLMRSNVSEVMRLFNEINKMGITQFGISRYVPQNNLDDQILSKDELCQFYKTVIDSNKHNNYKINCRDPLMGCSLSSDFQLSAVPSLDGCSIGFWGFCILHNGDIIPCSRLNIPLGNIQKDSLRHIWATSELLWNFRDFRNNLKGKCKDCIHIDRCRGCRAIAYAINHDCFSEDPQCYLS